MNSKNNNLSVVNYSHSINKDLNLDQLKKNIYTHPKLKNAIPYVTSYYEKNWGFCMSYDQKNKLKPGKYKIKIKSKIKNGYLNYGEANLKGKSKKTFLLSTFLCHPSMANNELSGPLTMVGLYNEIKMWKNRNLTYKFLINPETIGSISYLYKNKKKIKKIISSGTVLTCMGGSYDYLSYFKSRNSYSSLDRLVEYFSKIKKHKKKYKSYNFNPAQGGDERQFCSSEFNLPIGRFERNGKGHYKEYHTSLDTKDVMKISKVVNSIKQLNNLLIYNDFIFPMRRYEKYCEIFLSKRKLYPSINEFDKTNKKDKDINHSIIMTLLSYADGNHDYLHIANKFNFPLDKVLECLKILIKEKLVYLDLK